MPRGNPQNLKSFVDITAEEQREIARKGGQESGKARQKQKTLKELFRLYQSMPAKAMDDDIPAVTEAIENGKITEQEAIVISHLARARRDTASFLAYQASIGEKPADKQEIDLTATVKRWEDIANAVK